METPEKKLETSLRNTLKGMQDINSQYSETKKFLESKGVRHVSELDEKSMQELFAYLEGVLEDLTEGKNR